MKGQLFLVKEKSLIEFGKIDDVLLVPMLYTISLRKCNKSSMLHTCVRLYSTVEKGVGGVITPGPGPRRGPQKIQSMKIYYNNYQKLPAGAQQNLGKLLISGKLSGPGLVLVVII